MRKLLWAIPQKRLPQGEKMKVTYINKVCFPLKINEEGLHFDDEVKKVGNYMTSISFSAVERYHIQFNSIQFNSLFQTHLRSKSHNYMSQHNRKMQKQHINDSLCSLAYTLASVMDI